MERPEPNPWEARCVNYSICGTTILDTREAWNGVEGFVHFREDGGANHIALKKPNGLYMCDGCMRAAQAGLAPGQESLLEV